MSAIEHTTGHGDLYQELGMVCPRLLALADITREPSAYAPSSFGDAVVVLATPDLRIRVVRDRGQTSIDVANRRESDQWWMLPDILAVAKARGGHIGCDDVEANDLRSQCDAMASCYSTIVALFADDQWSSTKNELEAIVARRRNRLLRRLSGG